MKNSPPAPRSHALVTVSSRLALAGAVAAAFVVAACCPGKPAAEAPSAASAVAVPSTVPPAAGPALEAESESESGAYQIVPPADAAAPLTVWTGSVGCRLLSADRSEYACLEGGEPDMGYTHVSLTVRKLADGSEGASFNLYDGPTDFDETKLQPGLKEANARLRKGRFSLQNPLKAPSATVRGGRVVVGAASAPLPPMSTSAPTDALASKVEACCRWTVAEVTAFEGTPTLVVRLERPCDFGRPDAEVQESCRDPDYNPENDYVPSVYVSVTPGG